MNRLNVWLGWGLALVALVAGFRLYGWPGVLLAITIIVFWLLLQFNAAMRLMRAAGSNPVGHVASAVMLHAKLKPGMRHMQVVALTRALGEKRSDDPETYRWCDPGGAAVSVVFQDGRCTSWQLERPAEGSGDASSGHDAA